MAERRRLLSFDVGLRHLAFCDITVGTGDDPAAGATVHRWEVVDVTGPRATKKKAGIDETTEALLLALDARFSEAGGPTYDVVLIENQPACKNPMMKSVQMVLYTYFQVMRLYAGNVGAVRLVSATRKLSMRHVPAVISPADAPVISTAPALAPTQAAAYRERKLAAVRLCRHYLDEVMHDAASTAQLSASRKKDDLCDCMLQALWFAERK